MLKLKTFPNDTFVAGSRADREIDSYMSRARALQLKTAGLAVNPVSFPFQPLIWLARSDRIAPLVIDGPPA